MKDIITAIGSLLLGGYVVYVASTYPRVGDIEMQAGFYPGMLGYLMVALGIALLVKWLVTEKQPAPPSDADYTRLAVLALVMVLYVAGMEWIGYALSTFLFTAVAVRLFHGTNKAALITGVLCSAALTGLFQIAFRSPLPAGLLF